MPTLLIYDAWEMRVDNDLYSGGSRSKPVELEVDGLVADVRYSLATATTLSVWDSSSSPSNFDFLWVESDQDVRIELTIDRGAEVGTILVPLLIEANCPFKLIYDDALANYTANFATGTADVIDRIRIRNVSGSTANLRVVLVT